MRKMIAFWLCLSVMPFNCLTASAEDNKYIDNDIGGSYSYINHGDHIEITGCSGGSEVYFPDEIEGIPVTVLAEGGITPDKERPSTGLNNDKICIIKLPDNLTAVPDGWFAGCSKLTTIILPETITSIGEGAFEGCDNLCDVMFQGTDAQWDAVTIGTSNKTLENACIQTNHNQVSSEKNKFVNGEDNWSFTNQQLTEYILSDETLLHYLEVSHPDSFMWYKARKDNLLKLDYQGACGGLALASYMASVGALDPSSIYEGAETLHDVPFCQEAIEAVTYYFMQTIYTNSFQYQMHTDSDHEYIESGAFLSDMEQSVPVMLSYSVDLGMHSVVAYGVEYGEWQYQDTVYTGKLIIYDNNFTDYTDKACIYFTDGFEKMYVPYWESSASFVDLFKDITKVPYGIGNRTAYQSTYASGDLNTDSTIDAADAASILTAAAASGSGTDTGLNNGYKSAADVNNDGVFDATDAAKILEYAAYAGSGGELTFEEYLSQ